MAEPTEKQINGHRHAVGLLRQAKYLVDLAAAQDVGTQAHNRLVVLALRIEEDIHNVGRVVPSHMDDERWDPNQVPAYNPQQSEE